jgi:transposase
MATGEVAMTYTRAAMERAMKVTDVLLQALNERQPWIHVAEVLGVSARTVRRLRWRYEHYGFDGLFDHRRQRPSPRCAPLAEVQHLLRLYRARYAGFNIRHFHQIAQREHGVTLSYSFVKQALQAAGLVAKRRPRGRHRRRREPRPCFGELVHLDGSLHAWLALVPAMKQTLIAVVDDATKQLLYAELVDGGESTAAIMTALRAVLERYGLPAALYTDRAHWAVHTPTSGTAPDRFRLTQLGRALKRLGIEHIVSYSPQARGRSERVNGTLQDRLVNELRVAGVRTVAAATTPDSVGRRPFRRPRSSPSAATISIRSFVTKKNGWSRETTWSRSTG